MDRFKPLLQNMNQKQKPHDHKHYHYVEVNDTQHSKYAPVYTSAGNDVSNFLFQEDRFRYRPHTKDDPPWNFDNGDMQLLSGYPERSKETMLRTEESWFFDEEIPMRDKRTFALQVFKEPGSPITPLYAKSNPMDTETQRAILNQVFPDGVRKSGQLAEQTVAVPTAAQLISKINESDSLRARYKDDPTPYGRSLVAYAEKQSSLYKKMLEKTMTQEKFTSGAFAEQQAAATKSLLDELKKDEIKQKEDMQSEEKTFEKPPEIISQIESPKKLRDLENLKKVGFSDNDVMKVKDFLKNTDGALTEEGDFTNLGEVAFGRILDFMNKNSGTKARYPNIESAVKKLEFSEERKSFEKPKTPTSKVDIIFEKNKMKSPLKKDEESKIVDSDFDIQDFSQAELGEVEGKLVDHTPTKTKKVEEQKDLDKDIVAIMKKEDTGINKLFKDGKFTKEGLESYVIRVYIKNNPLIFKDDTTKKKKHYTKSIYYRLMKYWKDTKTLTEDRVINSLIVDQKKQDSVGDFIRYFEQDMMIFDFIDNLVREKTIIQPDEIINKLKDKFEITPRAATEKLNLYNSFKKLNPFKVLEEVHIQSGKTPPKPVTPKKQDSSKKKKSGTGSAKKRKSSGKK